MRRLGRFTAASVGFTIWQRRLRMLPIPHRWLHLTVFLAVLHPSGGAAASTKDQQFAEIFRGWDQLRQLDESGRSYKVAWTQRHASGKPAERDTRSDVKVGRSLLRIHFRRAGAEGLIAINPDYCFALGKQKGVNWSLSKFSDEKVEVKNPVVKLVRTYGIFQRFPLSAILTDSPEDFRSLPKLEFLSCESLSPTRLRTKYRFLGVNLDGNSKRMVDGVMITDPTRHHCVMEVTLDLLKGRSFAASREVTEQDGQLVCKSATLTIPGADPGNPAPDYELFSFDNIRVNDPVPAEECYLTFYGLPEPIDVTAPRPTRSWWPYLLAAACLAAFVALFAWYRSRRTPREAAKP